MSVASSYTEVKAKCDESLEEHTLRCIESLKQYLKWQNLHVKEATTIAGLEENEMRSRLFATVYLHDIGKASTDFQNYMVEVCADRRRKAFPHALLSLPFILSAVPPIEINGIRYRFEAAAIMSHHTPFYDDLYNNRRDLVLRKYYLPFTLHFLKKMPEIYKESFGEPYRFLPLGEPDLDAPVRSLLAKVKDPLQEFSNEDIRRLHATYVAALHYSDWLASGNSKTYRYGLEEVQGSLLKSVSSRVQSFKGWYDFQKEAYQLEGNMLLQAPTGQGKTEASILWGGKNNRGGKIIYLLPTKVTVNAMYERLKHAFGEDVGVVHGTSALVVAEDEKWDQARMMSRMLVSGTFMLPVTVATVDQLLLSLFNWRHWEMVEQNASHSALIFDEIHAYDDYTMSLILTLAEDLSRKGAKFAFASATLPRYVEMVLQQAVGNSVKIIKDTEHLGLKRHRVEFCDQPIEEAISRIMNNVNNGKKVLIILNTVKKAIEFYRTLKEKMGKEAVVASEHPNLMLYHSRFIERDRLVKEKQIEQGAKGDCGFAAVTTQVVEVSLELDFDLLFTELAPVDALVQRLGRVNRQGEKPIGEVNAFVFSPSCNDWKIYTERHLACAKEIAKNHFNGKILSESSIRELLNQQYPPDACAESLQSERKKFNEDLMWYRKQLWHVQTVQLSNNIGLLYKFAKTREESFPDVEAIPLCFQTELHNLKHKLEAVRYLVRLPLAYFKNALIYPTEEDKRLYADVNYSFEEGVTGPVDR